MSSLRIANPAAGAAEATNPLLPALTGVRAMAAYLVFMHHFPPPMKRVSRIGWGILSEGHVGVTMFFVLSGFLIAYRYHGKLRLQTADLLSYFWNRFARIYPLYFLLLIPTLILSHETRFGRWLVELTLVKGLFDDYKFTGIPQAWSLTAEECFYFSAPLLLLALGSRFRSWVVPGCYAVAAGLLLIGTKLQYHQFFGNPRFVCSYTFLGRSFEFMLGAWMAMNIRRLDALRALPGKTFMGLAGIIAGMFIFDGLKRPDAALGVLTPQGIFLNNWFLPLSIGTFYLGLIQEDTWISRLFSARFCQLLGKSSYAFYLIHLGFISQFVAERASGVWFFVVLNLIAIVLFKAVEEPLNHLLRRIGPQRPVRVAPPESTQIAAMIEPAAASRSTLVQPRRRAS